VRCSSASGFAWVMRRPSVRSETMLIGRIALRFGLFHQSYLARSMTVHFRERIFGWDLIRINELIAMLGMAMMLENVVSLVVEDSVVIQLPMRAPSAHSLTLWSLLTGQKIRP
jgi:hypothetical protein